ncbi:MAG: ribonuclease P protein subunit [Desulfurococcales archaeon]|nr:ribonuclease P protein subunit [Desulfurococcales archaeon]
MKHKPWNIFFHELIGLKARILKALNPSLEKLEGVITWETRRTLTLRVPGGREITVLKGEIVLEVTLPSGEKVVLRGDDILGDPAERTKRLKRGRR